MRWVWKGGPSAAGVRTARPLRRRSPDRRYGDEARRWVGTGTRTRPDRGNEPNSLPREDRLRSNITREHREVKVHC
ncbi:hypothetical protein TPA0908_50760 [Micromonospora sp. AKA38]|nr:hypothetical protein TPA0908_50760 [Micromonospora sp. AKA38]